mmetsp:Transcript_30495/g.64242  ORF Transcript_30495/g.64242 Transcript_30495/m.64242 type:complete len:166 (-) Transcript_30495:521-1018(-)
MAVNPSGLGFGAFCDAVSIFAHEDIQLTKLHDLHKIGVTDTTECNYIVSFERRYPVVFVGKTDKIKSGGKIAVFKSAAVWAGSSGLEGKREEMETSLETARECGETDAKDNLPIGGVFLDLAKHLLTRSVKFHNNLHTHFNNELKKLVEMKIPEAKTLVLISEQL